VSRTGPAILRFDDSPRPSPSSPLHGGLEGESAFNLIIGIATGPPDEAGFLFAKASMTEFLDFDKQSGLITAVVQDATSHRVLMVGYMNREALDKTLASGHVTFFSRSRQKLWTKGESSGHYLVLKSVATDCDGDALLITAEQLGPGVCHTGYKSCFYRTWQNGEWLITDEKAYDPDAVYGAKQ
jgi:phosphoribosyl-AMP cyclohydrolase